MYSPVEGESKRPLLASRGDTPIDWKGNPPYPPLSGGQEKAKPPLPGGGASRRRDIAFLYPPDKGG